MKNAALALKSLFVVVAVPFVAVACCSDIEDPDDQLMIEVADTADGEAGETGTSPAACDATAVARDDDGEEIALEPQVRENSDGSERCVYVGTVTPLRLYTVEIHRGDKVGVVENATSNPGCSVATDPNDTDDVALLQAPQFQLRRDFVPSNERSVPERSFN